MAANDYSLKFGLQVDTNGFSAAMDRAQASFGELGKTFNKCTKEINKGTKEWGLDLGQFYNQGSSVFKKFGVDIDKFASHFGVNGQIVAGITAATVALEKLGSAMDAMTSNIAKGTGATGGVLAGLEESARNAMGSGVGRNAAEIGSMIADLNTRFGVTGKTLEELTNQFDMFSSVTDTDTKTAINSAADVMAKWNVNLESTPAFLNQLTYASQASGLSVTELMNGLKTGQAMFSNFGMSITESTAFLAQLKKNGVETNTALSAMRVALAKFSAEGKNAKDAFAEVSGAIANAKNNTEALKIATETFGTKAGAEMVKVLKQGTEASASFAIALENVGTTLEDTDRTSRTVSDAMDDLKAVLMGTFGQLGQTVSGAFKDLLDVVSNIVSVFQKSFDSAFGILRTVVTGMTGQLSNLAVKFTDVAKRIGGNSLMVKALNSIKSAFERIFKRIETVTNTLYKAIVVAIDGIKIAFLNLKIAIGNIINPIAEDMANAFNKIIEVINKGVRKVNEAAAALHLDKLFQVQEIELIDPVDLGVNIAQAQAQIAELKADIDKTLKGTQSSIVETGDVVIDEITDIEETEEETSEVILENKSKELSWQKKLYQQAIANADETESGLLSKLEYEQHILEIEEEEAIAAAQSAEEVALVRKFYANEALKAEEDYNNKVNELAAKQMALRVIKVKQTLSAVSKIMKSAAQTIGKVVQKAFSVVGSVFDKIINLSLDDMLDNLLVVEDKILTFFIETLPMMPQYIASAIQSVAVLMKNLIKVINFSAIQKNLSTMIKYILKELPSMFQILVKLTTSLLSSLVDAVLVNVLEIMTAVKEIGVELPKVVTSILTNVINMLCALGKEVIPALLGTIAVIVDGILQSMPEVLQRKIPELLNAVFAMIQGLATNAAQIITAIVDGIPVILEGVILGICDWIKNLSANDIVNFITAIVKAAGDIAAALIKNIGSLIEKLIPALVKLVLGLVAKLPEIIISIASGAVAGAWELLKSIAQSIGQLFVSAFSAIGGALSAVGDWIKGIFGFATGTNNAPSGLALVGEQGPELIDFHGGERVYNAQNTKAILGNASGGNSFNVTFNNVQDTTAYTMMKQLKAYNRQMAINGVL